MLFNDYERRGHSAATVMHSMSMPMPFVELHLKAYLSCDTNDRPQYYVQRAHKNVWINFT